MPELLSRVRAVNLGWHMLDLEAGDWEPLSGGTMASVYRSGNVVRRSTGSWTPAVHALLRHLEAVGFDRAPRVLGTDAAGRELLSFLPGTVPSPRTWRGDDRALVAAGRLLRSYHEAVASFPIDSIAGWDTFLQESATGEIVCHNDFAVYNCVFVDGLPWGLIDFDGAAPGSRIWDLAGAVVSFAPLNPYLRGPDRPRRLRLLCDAYGLTDRSTLVEMVERRIRRIHQRLVAVAGTDAPQAKLPPSHTRFCTDVLNLIAAERPALSAALR